MMIRKSFSTIALLVFLACLTGFVAQAQPQSSNEVVISNYSFQPDTLTVPAGTTVTWTNSDTPTHTVTSDDGTFNSGDIVSSGQFSHLFSSPGNYPYHCSIHTYMHGTVQVTSGEVNSSAASANSTTPGTAEGTVSQYTQYF